MKKIVALDGIRGFLIIFVLIYHYFYDVLEVVWFMRYALSFLFVLSGFIICLTLLKYDNSSSQHILLKFIGRRCIRVLPAYFFTTLVLFLVQPFDLSIWVWTFLLNFKIYFLSTDWGSEFSSSYFVNWKNNHIHLWSVSIEEQFYITIPPILYLLKSKSARFLFLIASLLLSVGVKNYYLQTQSSSFYGALPLVCGEYLIVGSLYALLYYYNRINPYSLFDRPWVYLLLLITLTYFLWIPDNYGVGIYAPTNWQTLYAFLMGGFIYSLSLNENSISSQILHKKIFLFLGKISYGIYLWHLFGYVVLKPFFNLKDPLHQWILFPISQFFLSVMLAFIMWEAFEKRLNEYRNYLK